MTSPSSTAEYVKVRSATTYAWEFFINRYDEELGQWWSGDILVVSRS
jgi:hypothetical protein